MGAPSSLLTAREATSMAVSPSAPTRPLWIGIVNVTPDSFSDGGEADGLDRALERCRQLVREGADILDIGGESTRPGAEPVPEHVELERVIPLIHAASRELRVPLSVDTRHASVAHAALHVGATIVNDITGLGDPRMRRTVLDHDAQAIIMHMQGQPRTMQAAPAYVDVVAEVSAWLVERVALCVAEGIPRERLWVDPGVGFGKTLEHNLALIRHLDALRATGCRVVLGASRKSWIGRVAEDDSEPRGRDAGSVAAMLFTGHTGTWADAYRIHNVAAHRQAHAVWAALGAAP